jgi:hypothetical protein
VILANDNKSFVVLERSSEIQKFTLAGTTLNDGINNYSLTGISKNPLAQNLKQINGYQEYWHSWKTFHPLTQK